MQPTSLRRPAFDRRRCPKYQADAWFRARSLSLTTVRRDDSVARAKSACSHGSTIIENGANLGFAKACNIGARAATTPLLFFFNPDARAHAGLLAQRRDYFDAHPDVAMAGAKLLKTRTARRQRRAVSSTRGGRRSLRSSAWGELPWFRAQSNGYGLRNWDYSTERDVDLVVGAAMFIRADIFDAWAASTNVSSSIMRKSTSRIACATAGGRVVYLAAMRGDAQVERGGSRKRWGRLGVLNWRQRSRRLYWIKHHGLAWYWSLSAALAVAVCPLCRAHRRARPRRRAELALLLGHGVDLSLEERQERARPACTGVVEACRRCQIGYTRTKVVCGVGIRLRGLSSSAKGPARTEDRKESRLSAAPANCSTRCSRPLICGARTCSSQTPSNAARRRTKLADVPIARRCPKRWRIAGSTWTAN